MAHSSVIITTACTSHGDVMELTIVKIFSDEEGCSRKFHDAVQITKIFHLYERQ